MLFHNSIFLTNNLSGKRDSNSQPLPWQGSILPIELFPLYSRNKEEREGFEPSDLYGVAGFQDQFNKPTLTSLPNTSNKRITLAEKLGSDPNSLM